MSDEIQKTILLVEKADSAMNRKRELEHYGYQVIPAKSDKQAVDIVKNTPDLDLVLMDIDVVDGMDGTQVDERILKYRDLPVVFLFSPDNPAIVNKPEVSASFGYVDKNSPVTILDVSIKNAITHFETRQKLNQEISSRKQSEEALKESKEKYRSLVENMNEIIYVLNDKAEIEYISPNFAELSGYSYSEIIGKCFVDFVHPEDKQGRIERFKTALSGANEVTEYRFVTKDGRTFWMRTSARPVIRQGRVAGVQGILNDITDRKQAEEEIKKQLSEKETILKEVHHRVKNNLASVEGFLQLQLEAIDNPEALSTLHDAIARVQSMRVLYDKLLVSEAYQEVSVKDYIESLVDSIIASFNYNIEITVNKQITDFNFATKDLFSLGMIINELITNTMKYSFVGRDSGLITVSLDKVENHVTLTVQDNGNGLPDGFDVNESQGFGLMLVSMLTQQMGGSFTMEDHNGTRNIVKFGI